MAIASTIVAGGSKRRGSVTTWMNSWLSAVGRLIWQRTSAEWDREREDVIRQLEGHEIAKVNWRPITTMI